MSALQAKWPTGILLLEDGTSFLGYSFGYEPKEIKNGVIGEVVFNTAMSGYQEILSDPSYYGQIVVMTYPHIGNYGINYEDIESRMVKLSALVVHEYSDEISNWRAKKNLRDYLLEKKIPALTGVDTRAITRHIRAKGAMNAYIVSPAPKNKAELDAVIAILQKQAPFGARDLVADVSCKEAYEWTETCDEYHAEWNQAVHETKEKPLVVVMDFGVKFNMLRSLALRGCRVRVVPVSTSIGRAHV